MFGFVCGFVLQEYNSRAREGIWMVKNIAEINFGTLTLFKVDKEAYTAKIEIGQKWDWK